MSRRISNWSFRLMQEYKRCDSAQFVTLTYDTDHVPISPKGFMTLSKTDPQKFLKRLRKRNPDSKLKYYLCGEYGTKNMRPHYHLILFNARLDTIQPAWSVNDVYIGDVHYGEVNEASVGYTLKYMSKLKQIPLHANDDRLKEFALMSKGLGDNYLTEAMKEWHKADLTERMYLNLKDGKKIAMPRYYKDKIYDENERDIIGASQGIKARMLQDEYIADMQKRYGNNWEEVKANSDIHAFKMMHEKATEKRNL